MANRPQLFLPAERTYTTRWTRSAAPRPKTKARDGLCWYCYHSPGTALHGHHSFVIEVIPPRTGVRECESLERSCSSSSFFGFVVLEPVSKRRGRTRRRYSSEARSDGCGIAVSLWCGVMPRLSLVVVMATMLRCRVREEVLVGTDVLVTDCCCQAPPSPILARCPDYRDFSVRG